MVDLVQIKSLRHQFEMQEAELRKSKKQAQEAMASATEESVKCNAAKEVIKSLTTQVVSCPNLLIMLFELKVFFQIPTYLDGKSAL